MSNGSTRAKCVFCQRDTIIDLEEAQTMPSRVFRFPPLNPVIPGHMLFVPGRHVETAAEATLLAGDVFACAAKYAKDKRLPFNLITSGGEEATQTVKHFHVHYIPRREGDGLHLPWTGQQP